MCEPLDRGVAQERVGIGDKRYDGVANGLDAATRLAQSSCGQYGKIAKLRKTYYEGLGVGERFAFFDCI